MKRIAISIISILSLVFLVGCTKQTSGSENSKASSKPTYSSKASLTQVSSGDDSIYSELPSYEIVEQESILDSSPKKIFHYVRLDDRKTSAIDLLLIASKISAQTPAGDIWHIFRFYGKNDYLGAGPTVAFGEKKIGEIVQITGTIKSWENAPPEEDFDLFGKIMTVLYENPNTSEDELLLGLEEKIGLNTDEMRELIRRVSPYTIPHVTK